jgi:prevent-host-death family protein
MMQLIVGVTELQRRFRSFFDQVVGKRSQIILTRGSRPEAVLIPYEDYVRFQQMQESEVLARRLHRFRRCRFAGVGVVRGYTHFAPGRIYRSTDPSWGQV